MIREELIRGINLMAEGKTDEGLHMFFMQTYEFVYQRARYVMQGDVDTLELTKQTFMQVSREIETLEDINAVHTWLCNILCREGMKMLASPETERMHEILNEDGDFQTVFSEDKYQISVEEAQDLYQEILEGIGKSPVINPTTKGKLSLATKQILGGIAVAVIGVAVFVGVTYGKNANHQDVPNKSSEIKVGNTEEEDRTEENTVGDGAQVDSTGEEDKKVESEEQGKLDIAPQLQLIVDSKSTWYEEPYSENEFFYYSVTDLDQNGRLEVIKSIQEGSGFFTYTNYYEVTEDGTELKELTGRAYEYVTDTEDQPDLGFDKVVYLDPATNYYYYLARNDIREVFESATVVDMAISIQGEDICIETIGSYVEEFEDNFEGPITYYNAKGDVITEQEAGTLRATRFAEMEPMTLSMDWYVDDTSKEIEIGTCSDEDLLSLVTKWYDEFSLTQGVVEEEENKDQKEEIAQTQETEPTDQIDEVGDTQEETAEVVDVDDTWVAEAAETSGISKDELLAAYQEGMNETGCRQTAGMYIEYIEVIGDKIIIKIDEKSGYISAISSDYINIDVQTKEPRKVFVYDVAENCLFGEYAITPGGDTVSYSLTNEFDFATIQGYVNEDRKVLEEYGDVGMTAGISFKVEDGLLKELCTMVS